MRTKKDWTILILILAFSVCSFVAGYAVGDSENNEFSYKIPDPITINNSYCTVEQVHNISQHEWIIAINNGD